MNKNIIKRKTKDIYGLDDIDLFEIKNIKKGWFGTIYIVEPFLGSLIGGPLYIRLKKDDDLITEEEALQIFREKYEK